MLHFNIVVLTAVLSCPLCPAFGKDLSPAATAGYHPAARTITGRVINEKHMPLQGVTVRVKGTSRGAITDKNGHFSVEVETRTAVLVFTYLGYQPKEIVAGEVNSITVTLKVDQNNKLNDLVVIGYGTQRKEDLTGAISQVNADQLKSVPVYNIADALQGKASGVRVTQNSGSPGGRIQVRIRGGNSMIGSNDPLYVVDGFPVTGGIDYLNPSDIASFDILKDASATAIYGSRGANGVVIITTKTGKKGRRDRIDVESYFGFQKDTKRYKVLNARQYAVVANEWLHNQGLDPYFSQQDIQGLGTGTDWQDAIYRTAPLQSHTITFTGASDKTTYAVSGNFFSQDGTLINSSAKRASLQLNLDHEVNKVVTVAAHLRLSKNEIQRVPVDNGAFGKTMLSGALSAPPTLPIYDSAGLPTRIEQAYSFGSIDMRNPMIFGAPRKDNTVSNHVLANTSISFNLAKGLIFKTLLGTEFENNINTAFTPIIYQDDKGSASDGYSNWSSYLSENTLHYTKALNDKNSLDLLGGFTYQYYGSRYENAGVTGLSSNITEDYNIASAAVIGTPSNGVSSWKLYSWLGRVNYTFNHKYLATFSMRADGSSRFGGDNKWGIFPSGALAWRVSEEPFMKNVVSVSNLKIRTSYGITGNTALNPYQSLSRLSSDKTIYGNQTEVIGYAPTSLANPELKWETTAQLDIGIDLGLFKDALRFNMDYYKKNTTNLLASVPLPTSTGFGSVLQNIGEIQNQGFEFMINANILNKSVMWDIGAQISFNKNKVLQLAGNSDIYSSTIDIPFYSTTNIARVGQPFGVFYGYREDGLSSDGYIQYMDTNGDKTINPSDRVILGSPYPDFTYGFNSHLSYKHFDLTVFLDGVYGNKIFWATAGTQLNSFQRGQNQFADLFGNYWTEEKPDPHAKYPRISSKTVVDVSDRFIKDGSYLRVKTLSLAYNLPVTDMKISWCSSAQLYISASNLFTFTNYPGLDPEANTTGTDAQSIGSRLQVGIDQGAYPTAKSIILGIKLGF